MKMKEWEVKAEARQKRQEEAVAKTRKRSMQILAVALCAIALCVLGAALPARGSSAAVTTIVVNPGETLWSIAQEHPLDGTYSTEETVAYIKEVNHLSSSDIQVGAELKVPTTQADATTEQAAKIEEVSLLR